MENGNENELPKTTRNVITKEEVPRSLDMSYLAKRASCQTFEEAVLTSMREKKPIVWHTARSEGDEAETEAEVNAKFREVVEKTHKRQQEDAEQSSSLPKSEEN
ncbi:uncharacterized protein LOC108103828 [Drosophila eugracilis]|uniref:uncharacterized protein LOC108103828 n=1 Tax=Drosophila eugracilis TaxID=29029 RepID=UPI0007E89EF8|nr:uncharacterized protein LOC108103828 [Drosophila eugracilis]